MDDDKEIRCLAICSLGFVTCRLFLSSMPVVIPPFYEKRHFMISVFILVGLLQHKFLHLGKNKENGNKCK